MTSPPKPNPKARIQIQADDQTKQGLYCNMAMITHTAEEFVTDFLFLMPRPPYGKLNARILMSPGHAKRLARALQENLDRYESQFGEIKEAPVPPGTPDLVH